jgi:hypothetical protein
MQSISLANLKIRIMQLISIFYPHMCLPTRATAIYEVSTIREKKAANISNNTGPSQGTI